MIDTTGGGVPNTATKRRCLVESAEPIFMYSLARLTNSWPPSVMLMRIVVVNGVSRSKQKCYRISVIFRNLFNKK